MSKLIVVLSMALLGFYSVAVDGDFKGSTRIRTNIIGNGGSVADSFGSVSDLSSLELRAYGAGKFKPSESFEAKIGSYVVFDGAEAEILPIGYGDWMISDEVMIRGGRTLYQIGNGSVIAKNKYENFPVYFEGIFLTVLSESFGLDIALAEAQSPFGDVELSPDPYGIVSIDGKSLPDVVKHINLHAIVDVANTSDLRLGGTIGGKVEGFGYKVTVASDSGMSAETLLINGKVGYAHEWNDQKVKVYVGAHRDGAEYDAFLYDRHKYAGAIDLVNWGGGLQYANAGVAYWVKPELSFGLKGYYFSQVGSAVAGSVEEAVAEGDTSVSDFVVDDGSMELDVYVKKEFNSSVYGKLWLAALRNSAGDHATKIEAQLKMKF